MATFNAGSFGLALSNVPAINIRLDFNTMLGLFRNEQFRQQFQGHRGKPIPIRTNYFTWHGRANVLLTHMLREAAVGIESAVSSAVFSEALDRGLPPGAFLEATRDPFRLKGRGTAENVYNRLPALIDPGFAMKVRDPDLWKRVTDFYQGVRNKIFHAYEIESNDAEPVWHCLEFIRDVHAWLNGWHPISNLAAGPVQLTPEAAKRMEEVPIIDDLTVRRFAPSRRLPEEGRVRKEDLPSGVDCVAVEDVTGIFVDSSEIVDVSMISDSGAPLKVQMSTHAAMRLLGYLARAHDSRGWALPDRL